MKLMIVMLVGFLLFSSSVNGHVSAERFFNVYTDKNSLSNHFYPSGWVGDWADVVINDDCRLDPQEGRTCVEVVYFAEASKIHGWAGIYWLHPADNWGDRPGGFNLTGVIGLSFWAKGAVGGERVEFRVGGVAGVYGDSLQPAVSTGVANLTSNWQRFSINLLERNVSRVVGGFCWIANRTLNPDGTTFYLDDIKYEYGYVDGSILITQPADLQELKAGLEYTVTVRVHNNGNLPTSEFKVSLDLRSGIVLVGESLKTLVLEYDAVDDVSFEIRSTGIGEQTVSAILYGGGEELDEHTVSVIVGEPSFVDLIRRNIVMILIAMIFAIAIVIVTIIAKRKPRKSE